jgi:hypothetical protein
LIEYWDGTKWTGHQAAPEPELQSVGAPATPTPMAAPAPAAAPNPFAPADPLALPPPALNPAAPAAEVGNAFSLNGRLVGLITGVVVLIVAVALILTRI